MPLCTSVYLYLVVTYWERTGLLALVCGVSLQVCHFPIGILGQVWYLIVSIPDLCTLTNFFFMFSLYGPLQNILPPGGPILCPKGHNLNILGRGLLGDVR